MQSRLCQITTSGKYGVEGEKGCSDSSLQVVFVPNYVKTTLHNDAKTTLHRSPCSSMYLGNLVSSSYCASLSPSSLIKPFYMGRKVYCCPGDSGQLGVVQGLGFQGETEAKFLVPDRGGNSRLWHSVDVPAYVFWRVGTTILCQSRLYPPSLGLRMATGIRAFYVYIALFCYGSRAVNPYSQNPDPDPIWSPFFDNQKMKKKNTSKIFY